MSFIQKIMKSRKTLIIDLERARMDIINDIVSEAKLNGYKKDTMYRRLKGIRDLENVEQFFFMVRKIVRSELKDIKEVLVLSEKKFKEYENL